MPVKIKENPYILLLLLIGAVYFFLQFLTPLLSPVLTAMLFVTIFGPLLQRMQKALHVNRQLGAVILLLLASSFFILLICVLASWIVGSLPVWIEQLDLLEENLSIVVQTVCRSVGDSIGVDSHYLEQQILGHVQEGMDYFQMKLVPGMLSQSWQYMKLLGTLGGFLVTFMISAVLLAKDYDAILNRMLDQEEYHVLLEVICGIIRYIATFVKAQFIIMTTIAVIAAVVLGVSGIRHGVLWGILAGLLDALPFIGTGIVLIPLGLWQLFHGSYLSASACLILYIICIFLRELLEPKLIGKRVGVSPIAILISLYAGIQLFGIWGIIKGPLGFILIHQTYRSIRHHHKEMLQKNTE